MLLIYALFAVYGFFSAAYLVYSIYRRLRWKAVFSKLLYTNLGISIFFTAPVFIFTNRRTEFKGYGIPYPDELFLMTFIFGVAIAITSLPIVWIMHKYRFKGKAMYLLAFLVTYLFLLPIVFKVLEFLRVVF